jgi:hypothetical protein
MIKLQHDLDMQHTAKNTEDSCNTKWVSFGEDRACQGRCPVTHFLALAFADEVFSTIHHPNQLQNFHIGSQNCILFQIKESKKDLLLFRNTQVDGGISQEQALFTKRFSSDLAQLGLRAGFKDILRSYCLLRGRGNAAEGKISEIK